MIWFSTLSAAQLWERLVWSQLMDGLPSSKCRLPAMACGGGGSGGANKVTALRIVVCFYGECM